MRRSRGGSGREDPGRGQRGGYRVLAGGPGFQGARRRSHARRLHPGQFHQRRHSQQRSVEDGETAARQIAGGGGVRGLRPTGRHSRAGQPVRRERRLRRGLQGRRHTRTALQEQRAFPDFARVLRHSGGARPRHRRGLLRARLPAHAQDHRRRSGRAARFRTAAQRHGAGAGPGLVRGVPAQGHAPREDAAEGIQARPPGGGRPADLPVGAGPGLSRARHARRLRGPLPAREHALHGLLRSHQPGSGLRRQGSFRPGFRHR